MNTYTIKSSIPQLLFTKNEKTGLYETKVQADSISDGYHTMDELYEHRNRLFLALVKVYDNYITPLGSSVSCWKSKRHDDGTIFERYFILGMTVNRKNFDESVITYDISYHLPMKYWNIVNVIELPKAHPCDGYTSNDVLERLLRL